MIEQLLLKDAIPMGLSGRHFDYKKINLLSDEKFAQFYLQLMQEYRDIDGWWSEGRIPTCTHCRKTISNPKELRRYNGASLHPVCFTPFYDQNKTAQSDTMTRYWERVKKLRL
ncbi:MAG TPA: hypothetical protein VJK51_05425 [Candidatus Nanoarchaeia archaeon]|nr:hypothetical protein [Candidatus Nanoarchaeia archaeon]